MRLIMITLAAVLVAACSTRITVEHGPEPITIGIGKERDHDRDRELERRPPPRRDRRR